jgi:predicted ester cyclase
LRFSVDDIISEKDKVVVCWTISGTHKREFRGIPATNKKISFEGITINYVAGGKIMDSNVSMDYFGLMQQLGALPVPTSTKSASAR